MVALGSDRRKGRAMRFENPISSADLRDLRWYVETYGAHSIGEPDDLEAGRIADLLPLWGRRLFGAAFRAKAEIELFHRFQETRTGDRLLTVTTEHSAILALPWELLHEPGPAGTFLFHDNPRISIRRTIAWTNSGHGPVRGGKAVRVVCPLRGHAAAPAAEAVGEPWATAARHDFAHVG